MLLSIAGGITCIGPRFLLGILRYDTRHEGTLRVGERAPEVELRVLDGTARVELLVGLRSRPRVLIFGRFTRPPFQRSVERLRSLHPCLSTHADVLTEAVLAARAETEPQATVGPPPRPSTLRR